MNGDFRQAVIKKLESHDGSLASLASDMAEVKSDVAILKSDMVEVKSDVAILKSDMAEVKSDVAILKSDMVEVKSDVAILKSDVHRLGILYEMSDKKLDQILEVVTHNFKRNLSRDEFEERYAGHETRISALEASVKNRI